MKKNEFRDKKTFERPIKNVYQNDYVNDNKQDKKTPMRVIASILAIIAVICLFTIDNDTILGFICLAPAIFYALSYFNGERFPKDFFGMTNTLFLSGIWVFNALIWFL
jgi:1,4-dihydroxy-2-naphthoate octaprenyltransferase